MKPLASYYLLRLAVAINLSTAVSCVSYGPAITGSELPFVPPPLLDTVATVATGVYGTAGWPLTYHPSDNNYLMGVGVYQTRTRPLNSTRNAGWSFAYGGMAYTGQYKPGSNNTRHSYAGGLLHGAARWHYRVAHRLEWVLEPTLSLYYEGGEYLRFRQQNLPEETTQRANPVSATIHFSQWLRYQLNDHWVVTGAYTAGLPLDVPFFQYSFSGTLALSRGAFTVWSRLGVHINVMSPARLNDQTLTIGVGYRMFNYRNKPPY